MRAFVWVAIAIGIAVAIGAGLRQTQTMSSPDLEDPYIWLEEVHGEEALAWAEEHNAAALGRLKGASTYQENYDEILAILDAKDRIPYGNLHANYVFNFWQDAEHTRGIWRRATIASYETQTPEWETLLDVDALAAQENENWVYEGSTCTPGLTRCMVFLSRGGTDAFVGREFDLQTMQFVTDGFFVPEAKSDIAYLDADTLLVATDFGEGTLTQSGYPRQVHVWRRDERLASTEMLLEAEPEDIGAWSAVYHGPDRTTALLIRAINFYEAEYFHTGTAGASGAAGAGGVSGANTKLPLPLSAEIQGMMGDQLIVTLREDWTLENGTTIAQASLIAFPLYDFLRNRTMPEIEVLYTPGPRASIQEVLVGRDAVYAAIFENVTGRIHAFRRGPGTGAWSDTRMTLPEGGATGITSVNDFGPEAYFNFENFLTPDTLYADHGGDAPVPIKSLPARFDAEMFEAAQYKAVSRDGTRIPYFIVRARDADGAQPTVLYGYGGFEISQTPWYWAIAGRVWLSKGGSYAVANIRGGGEFGPAWHQAALKTNRQLAYDDFIAVAEDMIRRRFTTPDQLGIMGGSNGGLLVGAVMVQRPDLFGAVVCQVPLLDMIRYTQIGAGASWKAEYGDPDVPEERAAILRYSPYHNVRAGVDYPHVFFVTATSDDRVTPVHARKMMARMVEQGHEALFYENIDGGHAAAANNAQRAEMWALTYTYLAQELGLTR